MEICVRMGWTEKPAVTSGECKWKDLSRKEVEPAPLKKISFRKPKRTGRLDRQLPETARSRSSATARATGM